MPLQFALSSKGKEHLLHNGYRITLHRSGAKENFWCCAERRHGKCRGKAYTANNEVVRTSDHHNHAPDAAKNVAKVIRSKLKVAAETTSDSPQVVVASCTTGISLAASVKLPSVRTMKRMIRKDRTKSNNSHPIPISLLTLEIPDMYKLTMKSTSFLLFDSGKCTNRILLFGTVKNLQYLENSPDWYSDGTFKVAPQLFDQVCSCGIQYQIKSAWT